MNFSYKLQGRLEFNFGVSDTQGEFMECQDTHDTHPKWLCRWIIFILQYQKQLPLCDLK